MDQPRLGAMQSYDTQAASSSDSFVKSPQKHKTAPDTTSQSTRMKTASTAATARDERSNTYLNHLDQFFSTKKHYEILCDMAGGNRRNGISLRLLEFVCTEFSKSGFTVSAPATDRLTSSPLDTDKRQLSVQRLYKQHLASQGKRFFDPFRRGPGGRVVLNKFGREVTTSIAQMRFFKFAIRYGIIDYIKRNYALCERRMSEYASAKRRNRRTRPRRKRKGAGSGKSSLANSQY